MARPNSRKPLSLALHVESNPEPKAMLLAASFFDDPTFDAAHDVAMKWCCGLFNDRHAIPEVDMMLVMVLWVIL